MCRAAAAEEKPVVKLFEGVAGLRPISPDKSERGVTYWLSRFFFSGRANPCIYTYPGPHEQRAFMHIESEAREHLRRTRFACGRIHTAVRARARSLPASTCASPPIKLSN